MRMFLFILIVSTTQCVAQSPAGDWYSTIEVVGLPIVFHIKKEKKDYQITVDSPKQDAFGMPGNISLAKNNFIEIQMPKLGVTFQGTYYSDSIRGIFKQGLISEKMTFYREQNETKSFTRPQHPKAPYSYNRENIKFYNKKDAIFLSGTLTLPQNKTKVPAAILVSGSGPQNRDEEIMGHRPFWVISDYLTNLGYAVLRYDDRGTYDSQGDFGNATTNDFVQDAASAISYLKNHNKIDSNKIVVIGHSEGGLIANILGAEIPNLSGIISLAGTSIRGDSILNIQTKLIAESSGDVGREFELSYGYNKKIWSAMVSSESIIDFEKELTSISKDFVKSFKKEKLIRRGEKAGGIDEIKRTWLNPWIYEFVRYSPSKDIPRIGCHVLVLIGSRDIQVTSKENIDGYNRLLPKNDKLHKLLELKGLNHLFQHCKTCKIDEYGKLEETFSTIALDEMRSFLETIWEK